MLERRFWEPSQWEALRSEVASHGGFLAREIGSPAQLFQQVSVSIAGPGGELLRVEGQVVQRTPGGEVAVLLAPDAKARVLALQLETPGGDTGSPERAPQAPPPEAAAPEPSTPDTDADRRPGRWEELGKPERIKLARQGNAEVRRRVLKDPDQSLHAFVLTNPGLTAQELAALIRGGAVSAGLIHRIAERGDLLGNSAVQEALLGSPLTPVPLAVQLVGRVPLEVARRIAKTGAGRAPIVAAARKRVIPA